MSLQHLGEWGAPRDTRSPTWGLQAGGSSQPPATYRTSSPRRARKAPSSIQLIWFLSSCLWEKVGGSIAGTAQAESNQSLLMLLPPDPTPNSLGPPVPIPAGTHDSQILEVSGPTESFPGDGLDEVLTQIPAEERDRKENEQCLQSTMLRGTRASTGRGTAQHSAIPKRLWEAVIWQPRTCSPAGCPKASLAPSIVTASGWRSPGTGVPSSDKYSSRTQLWKNPLYLNTL